jgi:hypothetical protein
MKHPQLRNHSPELAVEMSSVNAFQRRVQNIFHAVFSLYRATGKSDVHNLVSKHTLAFN